MELTVKRILEGSRDIVLKEIEEKKEILEQLDYQIEQIKREEGAA